MATGTPSITAAMVTSSPRSQRKDRTKDTIYEELYELSIAHINLPGAIFVLLLTEAQHFHGISKNASVIHGFESCHVFGSRIYILKYGDTQVLLSIQG
jgi:hypothetical protein